MVLYIETGAIYIAAPEVAIEQTPMFWGLGVAIPCFNGTPLFLLKMHLDNGQ